MTTEQQTQEPPVGLDSDDPAWLDALDADAADSVPRYFTVAKAAAVLGVHPMTLKRWDNKGLLRPRRMVYLDSRAYTEEDIERARAILQARLVETYDPPAA